LYCYYTHNYIFTIRGLSYSATWQFISTLLVPLVMLYNCLMSLQAALWQLWHNTVAYASHVSSWCTVITSPYIIMLSSCCKVTICYVVLYNHYVEHLYYCLPLFNETKLFYTVTSHCTKMYLLHVAQKYIRYVVYSYMLEIHSCGYIDTFNHTLDYSCHA